MFMKKNSIKFMMSALAVAGLGMFASCSDNDSLEQNQTGAIESIQIQSTKNPVFGSLNTPFGIKSNALMGFYGHLDVDPSSVEGTPFAGIQSGDVQSPDAGTLYLTINPITNDFKGVNLELVNSKGQEAGIVLSDVTPSDEEVKFGYSRASISENSDNGFYMATAKIADLDKAKMNTNREALHDAALDLYSNRLDANFANITKVVLDQINGILPAYAVQATWTGADSKTHKVVSNYEIAAAAINPLGYNSLQEFDKAEVPGLDHARTFINDLTTAITTAFNTEADDIDIAQVIDILIATPKEDVSKLDKSIEVRNKNGVLLGYVQLGDLMKFLYPNIDESKGDPYTQISEALEQFKTFLTKNKTGKIDIENLRDRANAYIDKINNTFGKLFDIHHMLQPCMIVETSKVASALIGTEGLPQEVEAGKATVFLTSYNMDILAPAYKKALVVEGPNGEEQKSELLDCNQSAVTVDFSAPGKYKLTYYAMDFYGAVVKTVSYVVVN